MNSELVSTLDRSRESSVNMNTTILMPIGGKATRARSVTKDTIPKHLIPLGDGRTVLDVVCRSLQAVGFRDFVFCVGHHKDQIIRHLEKSEWVTSPEVSFVFSEETAPLGVDGAILNAIGGLGLRGRGLILPGDVMLPWKNIATMTKRHEEWGSDVTVGVTSYITDQTTDIGKIIVEDNSDRVVWCYSRTDQDAKQRAGSQKLTSAAATAISIERYAELCQTYVAAHPEQRNSPLSFRDHILPWSTQRSDFNIHAYDIQGEVLDLGTPSGIRYGQEYWQHYV